MLWIFSLFLGLALGLDSEEFSAYTPTKGTTVPTTSPILDEGFFTKLIKKFITRSKDIHINKVIASNKLVSNASVRQKLANYNWKGEIYLFLFMIVFFSIFIYLKNYNYNIAANWIKGIKEALDEQFAYVGVAYKKSIDSRTKINDEINDANNNGNGDNMVLLRFLGLERAVSYCSGRENISYCHININLIMRPVFGIDYIFAFFFGLQTPEDKVDLKFKISKEAASKISNFIFAFVNKNNNNMRELRDSNYYLSLTRTSDLPPNKYDGLSDTFVVMSESSEITEKVLSKNIINAITNINKVNPDLFKYLAITDLPADKPETIEQFNSFKNYKQVVLSLQISNSVSDLKATSLLITSVIEWVDFLVENSNFRKEAMKKVIATRENELAKLVKADNVRKQELLTKAKSEEKDKAKKANLSKLSAEEQRKQLQREKERAMKKQRGRMVR